MLYALIALCGILSFLAIRSTFYPLKIGASFGWWAFFIYWLGADILVDGSPADVAIMLLLIMLGMTFLLMSFITRKGSIEIEEEKSVGNIIKRIKYSAFGNGTSPPSNRESDKDYRKRVHHALGRDKARRRR